MKLLYKEITTCKGCPFLKDRYTSGSTSIEYYTCLQLRESRSPYWGAFLAVVKDFDYEEQQKAYCNL